MSKPVRSLGPRSTAAAVTPPGAGTGPRRRKPAPVAAAAPAEPPKVTPELCEQVAKRVLRARVRLALAQPFLATAVMRLPVCEVAHSTWCDTAATDGYHIFYNPAWVSGLRDAELRGVLAHEVLHVLFSHGQRRAARDAVRWNIACDFAINLLLVQQAFKLPKGGLVDKKWSGSTAEQIYEALPGNARLWAALARHSGDDAEPSDDDGASSGTLTGIGADLVDPQDPRVRPLRTGGAPDDEQLEELRAQLRDEALARLQGDAATTFRSECGADDARRIDWRALLRAWLHERIKGDWQSYPFSKRHLHRGLFMPSAGMAVPGRVVFAIDTSASMHEQMLAAITGELRAFRETFPSQLTVIQADARVQSVHTFEAMDGTEIPKRLSVAGRGGTDFRPVFDWVHEHAEGALVLYATDGAGTFPETAPICPTIWLLTPPHIRPQGVPFGVAIALRKT